MSYPQKNPGFGREMQNEFNSVCGVLGGRWEGSPAFSDTLFQGHILNSPTPWPTNHIFGPADTCGKRLVPASPSEETVHKLREVPKVGHTGPVLSLHHQSQEKKVVQPAGRASSGKPFTVGREEALVHLGRQVFALLQGVCSTL